MHVLNGGGLRQIAATGLAATSPALMTIAVTKDDETATRVQTLTKLPSRFLVYKEFMVQLFYEGMVHIYMEENYYVLVHWQYGINRWCNLPLQR